MKAIPPASLLRGCGVGGVLIAWAWLAHEASVGSGESDLAVALAGTWLLAVVVLLLWRSGKPCWLIAGGLLTVVAALCGWDLYVPDWVAAQEEFLSVRRMQGSDWRG